MSFEENVDVLGLVISSEEEKLIKEIRRYKKNMGKSKTLLMDSNRKMKEMVEDTIKKQNVKIMKSIQEYEELIMKIENKLDKEKRRLQDIRFSSYMKYPDIYQMVKERISQETGKMLDGVGEDYGKYMANVVKKQCDKNKMFMDVVDKVITKKERRLEQIFNDYEKNIKSMYDTVKEEHLSRMREISEDGPFLPKKEVATTLKAYLNFDICDYVDNEFGNLIRGLHKVVDEKITQDKHNLSGKITGNMGALKKIEEIEERMLSQLSEMNLKLEENKVKIIETNNENDGKIKVLSNKIGEKMLLRLSQIEKKLEENKTKIIEVDNKNDVKFKMLNEKNHKISKKLEDANALIDEMDEVQQEVLKDINRNVEGAKIQIAKYTAKCVRTFETKIRTNINKINKKNMVKTKTIWERKMKSLDYINEQVDTLINHINDEEELKRQIQPQPIKQITKGKKKKLLEAPQAPQPTTNLNHKEIVKIIKEITEHLRYSVYDDQIEYTQNTSEVCLSDTDETAFDL